MWKTALFLMIALIVLPIMAYQLDPGFTVEQHRLVHTWMHIYLASAAITFLLSTLTNNYSQVDKIWSILPPIYAWVATYEAGFEPRMVLMATLATLWGIRLTYNFARRGGYSWRFWAGEEDYRWSILQAKPGFEQPWKWVAFNALFISGYQLALIMLFTLPIVKAQGTAPRLSAMDGLLTAAFLAFLVMETVADQQQWNYQKEKYRRMNAGEPLESPYSMGFTHTGLWKYMRHPNYMAEQSIWVVFYLVAAHASGMWFNATMAGAILLILLFWGSSNFSEEISASKYPEYAAYQKKTGRFIPKWPLKMNG